MECFQSWGSDRLIYTYSGFYLRNLQHIWIIFYTFWKLGESSVLGDVCIIMNYTLFIGELMLKISALDKIAKICDTCLLVN